jgi:SepF-like predicted cell division protein (DUF552 family)
MKKFFENLKKKFSAPSDDDMMEVEEEYVELDTTPRGADKSNVMVRMFTLDDFSDVKAILDAIRDNNVIAFVNMKPLKDKDIIELKRAINKLKKTTDAIKGEIAGMGDDHIIIVPEFAKIYRPSQEQPAED